MNDRNTCTLRERRVDWLETGFESFLRATIRTVSRTFPEVGKARQGEEQKAAEPSNGARCAPGRDTKK